MPRKAIYRYTVTTSDGVSHSGSAPQLAKIFDIKIDTVYSRIRRGFTPEQIFGVEPLPKNDPKPHTQSEKKPAPPKQTATVKDKTICKACRYWSRLAGYSSTHACAYLATTGTLPSGYTDSSGHWHRDPGPCAVYVKGRFRSEYNFVHHDLNYKPKSKC